MVADAPNGKYVAEVEERKRALQSGCVGPVHNRPPRFAPFTDFFHKAGKHKIWGTSIKANKIPSVYNESLAQEQIWLYWLGEANRTLRLNLPSFINCTQTFNPLGLNPTDLTPSV